MTWAASRRCTVPIAAFVLALLVSGCIVDQPVIETTDDLNPQTTATPAPTPTVQAPQFEPTVTPAPPTATPIPTPTTPPTPTPPTGPTPLPTSAPAAAFEPVVVEAGLVSVPVRDASFRLSASHPVLQLGGHTLIYVDDERNAEVDIFVPVADGLGQPFADYDELLAFINSNSVFADLMELTEVSIAGHSTRVFEGPTTVGERAFVTDLANADDEQFGWFPPMRMRLWVIDHPAGPVIVSAESLENPGRYSEAVRLATEVLSTIDFG